MSTYNYNTVTEEPNRTYLYSDATAVITGKSLTNIDYTFGDTTLVLTFDVALTSGEETAIQSVVDNHDKEPLDALKSRLVSQANAIYAIRRDSGSEHNGSFFSGNINSIASAGMGKHKKSGYTYPINVPTLDGTKYSITSEADYDALFDAVELEARNCLESLANASDNIVTAVTKELAQAAYDTYEAI